MRTYAHRPQSSDGSRNRAASKPDTVIDEPRDVARKMRAKSLFEIRSEIRDAFRFVHKKQPVEAQIIINDLKAIMMGYK